MTINLSRLPTHLTLAVGESVHIALPTYAGSGNIWSVTCIRGQGMADVSVVVDELQPEGVSLRDGTAEPPPLVLSPERLVVRGLIPGDTIWRLVLARPFDASRPTATHAIRVTIMTDGH